MAVTKLMNEDENEEEIICTHLSQGSEGLGARDAAVAAGVAGTIGVAAPVAGTAILTGVGFTSSGIAAGSVAAGLQAGIGNVAAGSLFATCQSIGATGGFAILGPVGIGAAAVGGLGYLGIKALQRWWWSPPPKQQSVKPMCSDCRRKLLARRKR